MIACLDMEGVLTPEIWINVAERTGIPALRRTTRDEPDYDKLMRGRLAILDQHRLRPPDIQAGVGQMDPLEGAPDFPAWLRARTPFVILSDTFTQFAAPLIAKLGWPTLFCNSLEVDARGHVTGYRLRIDDGKRRAVVALRGLNFRVVAAGAPQNDKKKLGGAR